MKLYKMPKIALLEVNRRLSLIPACKVTLYEMFDCQGNQLVTLEQMSALEEIYILDLLELKEVKEWIIIDS
jgi:hypothetical protein